MTDTTELRRKLREHGIKTMFIGLHKNAFLNTLDSGTDAQVERLAASLEKLRGKPLD